MSLKVFLKNLSYLCHHDIRKLMANLDDVYDNVLYEVNDDSTPIKAPKIKSVEDTIADIIKNKASIVRFGDGELNLMLGKSIPCQVANKDLQDKLCKIFASDEKNLYVGIVKACYGAKGNLTPINKKFWRSYGPKFRTIMAKFLKYDKQYYAAEMTLAYSYYVDYDFKKYFSQIRKIWDDKEIVIVCGKDVFNNMTHNIFDNAKSMEYIYAPTVNAFESYDSILAECMKKPKNKIFICILGPTAKVLTYDLVQDGRQALDLGHVAKSYDWFMQNKKIDDMKSAVDFFSPEGDKK